MSFISLRAHLTIAPEGFRSMSAGTPKFVDFIALIILAAIGAAIVNALGHRLQKAPSIAVLRLLPADGVVARDSSMFRTERLAFVGTAEALVLRHSDEPISAAAVAVPETAARCGDCRVDGALGHERPAPAAETMVARSVDAPHQQALDLAAIQEPATAVAPMSPDPPPATARYDVVVSAPEPGPSSGSTGGAQAAASVTLSAPEPQPLQRNPVVASGKKPAPPKVDQAPKPAASIKACVWNFTGYPVVECS